jgi:hypothetical protein
MPVWLNSRPCRRRVQRNGLTFTIADRYAAGWHAEHCEQWPKTRLGVTTHTSAAGRSQLGDNLARPQPRGINISDGVFRDPLLLVAGIKDGRPVTRSLVVALAVQRRWIVDLEEKFQKRPITDGLRTEGNLNGFSVITVVAVGRVWHLTTGVADSGSNHARIPAQQILHTPKATAGKDCAFR